MRKTISIRDYCKSTGKSKKAVEDALVKNDLGTKSVCGCIGNEKYYVDPKPWAEDRGLAWSKGCGSGSRGRRTWSWNKIMLDKITLGMND